MTESGQVRDPGGRRAALILLAVLCAYVVLMDALLRPSGGLLFRPCSGLLGRYLISGEGGLETPVHERVDARLDFPVPQRLDAAYIFHWDMKRLGLPVSMPPYSIHWSGLLHAPEPGVYGFTLDAQGEVRLRIDGTQLEMHQDTLTERHFAAGWHPIALDYELAQGDARLVLSWKPPRGALAPVPSRCLAPDGAAIAASATRRVLAWVLLAAGAATALALYALGRRQETAPARYLRALGTQRVTLAVGAIVILAALLRFHDFALVPFHHETADEYQHAWEGWSLLHQGVPLAWSTFPDRYPIDQTLDFRWFGDRYVVVRPYFDHPPLFSILVGLVTSLVQALTPSFGYGFASYPAPWDFLSCTLTVMRLVPIVLSLIGIVLLYRVARAYGASERAALLGSLVYATLPVIVLTHRLVKAESLLALLFMGAILATRRHELSGSAGSAILAGLLCGLSIWTKATGLAVVAVILVLLLAARRYRGALLALGITGGFLLLYLIYAWALDFGIFLKVIEAQSTTKLIGLEALQDLVNGKIVTKYFGRGWYPWLLLCAALAAFRRERGLLLTLAVYGMVIAMTADYRVIYGWYRIPLYPFLCVAAGCALEEMIDEANLFRVAPFAVMAVSTGLLYALPASLTGTRWAVYLFALAALVPFLPRLISERPWTVLAARLATGVLVAIFLITSLVTIGGLLEIYAATRGLP